MARNLKGSGHGLTVVMVLLLPEEIGKKHRISRSGVWFDLNSGTFRDANHTPAKCKVKVLPLADVIIGKWNYQQCVQGRPNTVSNTAMFTEYDAEQIFQHRNDSNGKTEKMFPNLHTIETLQ